jgi:hypothetical protein
MFWVLVSIIALFFILLGFKKAFPSLCVICLAVFITWFFGLPLYFLNQNFVEIDPIVLAFLMGGSAVGFLYYLNQRLPKQFLVFRLPYLLTTLAVFYFILKPTFDFSVVVLLLALWAFFGLVFLFRNKITGPWFQKIIECCRNW